MPNTPTPQAKGEASRKFVDAMKQILSVPKSEMTKREESYQRERAAKKANRAAGQK
jgi:molybdopterin synthase catalytic subunit